MIHRGPAISSSVQAKERGYAQLEISMGFLFPSPEAAVRTHLHPVHHHIPHLHSDPAAYVYDYEGDVDDDDDDDDDYDDRGYVLRLHTLLKHLSPTLPPTRTPRMIHQSAEVCDRCNKLWFRMNIQVDYDMQ